MIAVPCSVWSHPQSTSAWSVVSPTGWCLAYQGSKHLIIMVSPILRHTISDLMALFQMVEIRRLYAIQIMNTTCMQASLRCWLLILRKKHKSAWWSMLIGERTVHFVFFRFSHRFLAARLWTDIWLKYMHAVSSQSQVSHLQMSELSTEGDRNLDGGPTLRHAWTNNPSGTARYSSGTASSVHHEPQHVS